MADVEIISENPLPMAALKEELERIKKRDKELNFGAAKVEEYLNQMVKRKNIELCQKLAKLGIPRLKEQHTTKIVDILPTTIKDLKVVLQGYAVTVSNENMKKIVDLVNEFLGSK